MTYTIEFRRFTADVDGYNAWDFLPLPPADGFETLAQAEGFIAQNHRGPDADGVGAIFEVVEQR